jgi:ABC-type phosphate transport system ATPase subunit
MVKPIKIEAKDFSVSFGSIPALKSINLHVYEREILSVIGPANSGKTTFLRAIPPSGDGHPEWRGHLWQDGCPDVAQEGGNGICVAHGFTNDHI